MVSHRCIWFLRRHFGSNYEYLPVSLFMSLPCPPRLLFDIPGRICVNFTEEGELVVSPTAEDITESFRGKWFLRNLCSNFDDIPDLRYPTHLVLLAPDGHMIQNANLFVALNDRREGGQRNIPTAAVPGYIFLNI